MLTDSGLEIGGFEGPGRNDHNLINVPIGTPEPDPIRPGVAAPAATGGCRYSAAATRSYLRAGVLIGSDNGAAPNEAATRSAGASR